MFSKPDGKHRQKPRGVALDPLLNVPTRFGGPCAPKCCTATAKYSGLKCGTVAVKRRAVCRLHGGSGGLGRRRDLVNKPLTERQLRARAIRALRAQHREAYLQWCDNPSKYDPIREDAKRSLAPVFKQIPE